MIEAEIALARSKHSSIVRRRPAAPASCASGVDPLGRTVIRLRI
jgi:hypothetical protein